jgi:sporulation protein YunB
LGGLPIFQRRRTIGASVRGKRLLLVLCVLAVIVGLTSLFLALERAIVPTLVAISETEVARVTNKAMIDAVKRHITAFLEGKTFLYFETGKDGQLLYIKTNTADLNRIQADALDVLQDAMKNLDGFSVYIPLGQAFGSTTLAHVGPKIKVTLYPYGTVRTQVRDSFDVTGINQARYNIFLNVKCTVRVVVPFISSMAEVSTDIPLTTVIIPGKVPDTYLNLTGNLSR